MSNATMAEIEQIGATAGTIWHYLNEQGPVAVSRLSKEIDAPRDVVMQGIGWLAREGKVTYLNGGRAKRIGLAMTMAEV